MSYNPPISIVLDFARSDKPEDPHAFRFEPQDYTRRSSDGRITRFRIEWSEGLIADIEALRGGRDPAVAQRVGDLLRDALERAGWADLGHKIQAANAAGRRLTVTLRSNAAELYALPWELLTIGPSGQHLGELPGVLLCHEWPATTTAAEQPCPRPEGGRILFAWSAAGGAVPASEHLHAIDTSCADGHVEFDRVDDVLPHASAAGLGLALGQAAAQGRPFAVLHLLCHGGRSGSVFGVTLDGADGSAVVIDGARLRQILVPYARTLRLVVLAACDGGNIGDPGNYLGSVAQALHRAGIQSVVASRYPLSADGSTVLASTIYRSMFVELRSLEQALIDTRSRLVLEEARLDWASVQIYAREADGDDTRPVVFRPYRGLLPFDTAHSRFFFGRANECREMLGKFQTLIDGGRPRLLIVAGASGIGMSSMVLSGVVPQIGRLTTQSVSRWEVTRIRPGSNPQVALAGALATLNAEEGPVLLIVDQFEEIFTHVDAPAIRESFVRQLWSLTSSGRPFHCIVTIRVDFLDDCGNILLDDAGTHFDRIVYDEAHRVFVARMGVEEIRAAIEGPAALVGLTVDPGLTGRLCEDVGVEPGALPLLQYALDRLWLKRVGRTLSARVYDELGGLAGALQRKADSLIDDMTDEERRQARGLLTRLVGISEDEGVDTRRRVELDELKPAEPGARAVFKRVLARLVDARLVVRNEEDGAPTLEIAHEAMIRKWPRLRTWLREDRYKILELQRLADWVARLRQFDTLLAGSQLEHSSDLVRRHADELDEGVISFVKASELRERRRRAVLFGSLVTAGLSAAAAVLFLTLWRAAQASSGEAQAQPYRVEADGERARAAAASCCDTVSRCVGPGQSAGDALACVVEAHALCGADKRGE